MSSKHPLRNGSGCADPTAYAALCCYDLPPFTPISTVYICSPYSGDTKANTQIARAFCATAVAKSYAPIAPHLLLPQFMDDTDPVQRHATFGINKHLLGACTEMWVYAPRISTGMRQEIIWAKQAGMRLRFFDQNFKEVTP